MGSFFSDTPVFEDHNPVSYEKKDKVTGKPLRAEDIVKGYQYEPGQYVIVEQEDLDKVKAVLLDVADKKWNDSTVEIEQAETFIVDKVGDREIAREGFAGETAYDDLFVGGGHGEDYCSGGLSHGVGGRNEKGAERVVILPLLC